MKKWILSALSCLLIASLAACGGSGASSSVSSSGTSSAPVSSAPSSVSSAPAPAASSASEAAPLAVTPAADLPAGPSKTQTLFMPLVSAGVTMEMEVQGTYLGQQQSLEQFVVAQGESVYFKTYDKQLDLNVIVLLTPQIECLLEPETSLAFKMEDLDDHDLKNADFLASMLDDMDDYAIPAEVGEIQLDGQTYAYEMFREDADTGYYCYDGDALAYIISDNIDGRLQMKITSFQQGADAALFTVPQDYAIIDVDNPDYDGD